MPCVDVIPTRGCPCGVRFFMEVIMRRKAQRRGYFHGRESGRRRVYRGDIGRRGFERRSYSGQSLLRGR